MLFENFDFNRVKHNRNKEIANIVQKGVSRILLDELSDYMTNLLLNEIYTGFINLQDTLSIEKNYTDMEIHIVLKNMEDMFIKLQNNDELIIHSGVHGCLDITPTVFSLITDTKYKIVELSRIIDINSGGWMVHGVFEGGIYFDFEGYNRYIDDKVKNFTVIDYNFINRFKDIKFSNLLIDGHYAYRKIILHKGWVFENEEIFNIFINTLRQYGYTNFASNSVEQKYTLHHMEIARYQDSKHINYPIGAYYINGVKKPKRNKS